MSVWGKSLHCNISISWGNFFQGLQWSWVKVAINRRIGSEMESLLSLIVWRRGTVVLKEVLRHFHTFIKMIYFGWVRDTLSQCPSWLYPADFYGLLFYSPLRKVCVFHLLGAYYIISSPRWKCWIIHIPR